MTINTLTLFALVLAIGLLVDDAIVVVENVERLMHEQGLSPKQASIESMKEMTGMVYLRLYQRLPYLSAHNTCYPHL